MKKRNKIILIILSGLAVAIIFGFVTFNQLKIGDFQPHINWARKLGEEGYLYLRANILFQRLVLVVRDLMPFNFLARISQLLKQIIDIKSYDISALIVTITAYLGTFYAVYHYIKNNTLISESKWKTIFLSSVSLIVLLVGPIMLFSYPDRPYLGYITGNPFHNPTYLLMRPFAVLFFILTVDSLFTKFSWKKILLASFVLIMATLSKPSFTISFIPTVFIMVLIYLLQKKIKKINFRFVIFSVFLTSVIVLLSQFVIMYTGSRGDRVLFSPFEAILGMVPDLGTVIISGLLSIVFPVLTVIFYWPKIRNNLSVQLTLVNFGISLLLAYLFTEQVDMLSLNFWWTPMMAVFLLFMVTLCIYINEVIQLINAHKKIGIKELILGGILVLHIISGVLYYAISLGPINPVQLR